MSTVAPTHPPASPGDARPGVAQAPEAPTAPDEVVHARVATAARNDAGSDATADGARSLLKLAGSVVAPTTFVTALLIYFGWSHAYWFFHYFGVNSTLLDLTTQDFVMRSVDALFMPITFLAVVGIVAIWLHRLLQRWVPAQVLNAVWRLLVANQARVGVVCVAIGLWGALAATPLEVNVAVSPTCLGVGAVLLTRGARTARTTTATTAVPRWATTWAWTGMFTLVGLSLLWIANDYSADVGTTRARLLEQQLAAEPGAAVFSRDRLSVTAPGTRETVCADPEAAYRFRYDGLKLVLQAGDQYLFLPDGWSRRDGTAILISRDEAIRLEFSPPDVAAGRSATC